MKTSRFIDRLYVYFVCGNDPVHHQRHQHKNQHHHAALVTRMKQRDRGKL